jgi:hypothetical protein
MVVLVEKIIKLNKSLSITKVPTEKEMIQRQIRAIVQQVDNLVYELYGLNDKEIEIVKNFLED